MRWFLAREENTSTLLFISCRIVPITIPTLATAASSNSVVVAFCMALAVRVEPRSATIPGQSLRTT